MFELHSARFSVSKGQNPRSHVTTDLLSNRLRSLNCWEVWSRKHQEKQISSCETTTSSISQNSCGRAAKITQRNEAVPRAELLSLAARGVSPSRGTKAFPQSTSSQLTGQPHARRSLPSSSWSRSVQAWQALCGILSLWEKYKLSLPVCISITFCTYSASLH